MNKFRGAFVGFLVLGSALSFAASSVTGKVSFKGGPVKADALKMNADPKCDAIHKGQKVTKEDIVVNTNGTLANVFIYVKEGVKKEAIPAAPATPVVFDQKGCLYQPRVVGVRVNQNFEIRNSDPTTHNVNAVAKTATNKFNNGMPGNAKPITKQFKNAELGIRVKCDVHPWMLGWLHVMEHPFFAVTGADGSFTIADLPAGEYTVAAWHEKLGETTQKIKVVDGAPATAEFTLEKKG